MRLHGGAQRGVVFATATPVANTMAEVHTMMRYLQPRRLEALGLQQFDAWAATFGESVTALEIAPDGSGYRMTTRFARFINVPELMAVFGEVADIRTAQMLQLPVPALRGGKPRIVACPASNAMRAYVRTLVGRAEAIRMGHVKPQQDNMLAVTTDGRKAALDFRLVAPSSGFDASGKVAACVREVLAVRQRTEAFRGAQLVFCDFSSPKEGKAFSVYDDLKQRLVEAGVLAQEVAFVHDADTDAQKATLFKAVREGRVRVLLGSTAKMGIGTNVQTRLAALHHLDAPWRPCDVEQREGRILRQGNQCEDVEIFRYVTEGSFDSYMWQALETKARFIAQVMSGDKGLRSIEDVELAALSYAEVKALASGNPLVIEKAGVDAEVAKLSTLFSVWRKGELSAFDEALSVFPVELIAQAGCVVCVGRSGVVEVKRGLVRPEDRDALVQAARQSSPREAAAGSALISLPKGGTRPVHSEKLMRSLSAHRVAAIQAELLLRPDVALAAITAQLAVKLLKDGLRRYRGSDEALTVSATETHDALRRECASMADAEAWKLMEQARIEWIARLPEDGAALLPWLLTQERATVVELLTFLVASSVTGVDGVERERQSSDALAQALALDMRRWWKASAASYFSHVSKATTLAAVTEAAGANAAAPLAGLKKEGAAAGAEQLLAQSGWLPRCLRTQAPACESAGLRTEQQAMNGEGEDGKAYDVGGEPVH